MFITHRKGLAYDGKNPTYLYGYGGFNIPLTLSFSVSDLVFMELGGIIAYANLCGGGEYGEEWHKAGTRLTKQNVFDDFIACAQHLIDSGVTSPAKLAIQGGSNGGLLMGAVSDQIVVLGQSFLYRLFLDLELELVFDHQLQDQKPSEVLDQMEV
jgi:prolyl oligopeptidase